MARGRTKNSKVDIRVLTAEQAAMSDNDEDIIEFTEEQKHFLQEEQDAFDDLHDDLEQFSRMIK